ncbi:Imm21 family immunity protein [Nonomuraea sp. NPDC003201]
MTWKGEVPSARRWHQPSPGGRRAACVRRWSRAVEGYIGTVTVGAQQALVLGDEPAMTTYLPTERLLTIDS